MNRDRFVLSSGHGCMLQYALLHLTGYDDVTMSFRQWGSKTPGHPENFETRGVEVTTGPLGMGISNAVGLAAIWLLFTIVLTITLSPLLEMAASRRESLTRPVLMLAI